MVSWETQDMVPVRLQTVDADTDLLDACLASALTVC